MSIIQGAARLRAKAALATGERRTRIGELDRAALDFERAAVFAAKHPDIRRQAHDRAADVFAQLDHPADSLRHLQALVAIDGMDGSAWRRLAGALDASGDAPGALEAWGRVLAAGDDGPDVRERLLELTWALDRRPEALVHARNLAERAADDDAAPWRRLAKLIEQAGDQADAADTWRRVLGVSADDGPAHQRLAELCAALGLKDEAIVHMRAIAAASQSAVKPWRRLARALQDAGDAQGAVEAWRKLLDIDAADVDAHVQLGDLLFGLNRRIEAIEHLKVAADHDPGRIKPWKRLGRCLQEADDAEGAVRAWRAVLAIDKGDTDAHIQLGGLLYSLDRYPEAIEHLGITVEAHPDQIKPRARLARTLQSTGDSVGAVEAWRGLLEVEADNRGAHREAGLLLLGLGRLGEAAEHLSVAAAAWPKDAALWRDLALCRRKTGDYEGAVAAWRGVLKARPGDLEARQQLAALLLGLDRKAEAVEHLRSLAKAAPSDVKAWKRLAECLEQTGQVEEAIGTWRSLLQVSPDEGGAHKALADIFERLGRDSEAVPHLKVLAGAAARGRTKEWKRLARTLERLDARDEEIATWRRVLATDGADAAALSRMADLHIERGDHAGAASYLRALVDLDPIQIRPWRRLAHCLEDAGDIEDAVDSWRRLLALDGTDFEAHTRLAELLSDLYLWHQAVPHLRALAQSAPKQSKPWKRLARAVQKSSDAKAALMAWRKVLSLEPDDLESHEQTARLLEGLGRAPEALKHLRMIAEAAPNRTELWRRLAPAGEDLETEIAWWRRVLEVAPDDSETRERLGLFLYGVGRKEEALPYLRALAETAPAQAKAWKRLARCLADVGDADRAFEAWKTVLMIAGDDEEAHERVAHRLRQLGQGDEAVLHERALHARASSPRIERDRAATAPSATELS